MAESLAGGLEGRRVRVRRTQCICCAHEVGGAIVALKGGKQVTPRRPCGWSGKPCARVYCSTYMDGWWSMDIRAELYAWEYIRICGCRARVLRICKVYG